MCSFYHFLAFFFYISAKGVSDWFVSTIKSSKNPHKICYSECIFKKLTILQLIKRSYTYKTYESPLPLSSNKWVQDIRTSDEIKSINSYTHWTIPNVTLWYPPTCIKWEYNEKQQFCPHPQHFGVYRWAGHILAKHFFKNVNQNVQFAFYEWRLDYHILNVWHNATVLQCATYQNICSNNLTPPLSRFFQLWSSPDSHNLSTSWAVHFPGIPFD